MSDSFIQKRLNSLHEIDCKIVSLLDAMSTIFQTYTTPKLEDALAQNELRQKFESQTKTVYDLVSNVAIDLRKEVKIMDDNVGVYDKNEDGVMILPISVDQKNSTLGDKKLKYELSQMDKLIHVERRPEVAENTIKEPASVPESSIKPVEVTESSVNEPVDVKKESKDDAEELKIEAKDAPEASVDVPVLESQAEPKPEDESSKVKSPELPEVKKEQAAEETTKTNDEGQDIEMAEVKQEDDSQAYGTQNGEDSTKAVDVTDTLDDDMLFGGDDDTDMFF